MRRIGSGDAPVVMKEGRVVFEGTQHELEASQDAYIQKFVPKYS